MNNINEFFDELETLYKKYGISIAHEDGHGGFIIEKFDESNVKWIRDAFIQIEDEDEKPTV